MAARKKAAVKSGVAKVTASQVKAFEEERDPLLEEASELVVSDQVTLDRSAEILQIGKALMKKIDVATEPSRKATHEAWLAVKAMQSDLRDPIKKVDKLIRDKVSVYWAAEEERQRLEQERLDREHAQKLAAEEEEREKEREQAEAAQRKKRSDELAAAGDFEGADAVLRGEAPAAAPGDVEAWEDDSMPQTPELAPVAAPAVQKPRGLSMPKRWIGEVVDDDLLLQAILEGKAPRSLFVWDQKVLNELAKSMGGQLNYPGVRARQVTGTSLR